MKGVALLSSFDIYVFLKELQCSIVALGFSEAREISKK